VIFSHELHKFARKISGPIAQTFKIHDYSILKQNVICDN